MFWIALRMLLGDRGKYVGLISGIAFSAFLMSQQISIFMGIITRCGSQILDVNDAEIWVTDNKTRFNGEAPAIGDSYLYRVRSTPGVQWAVPLYYAQLRARLENGNFRAVLVYGVDDASLVGAPQVMLMGSLEDLRKPDAVVVDKAGYEYMWPGEPYELGRVFEVNDRRAVLVGICQASPPFMTLPVMYTRYSEAAFYAPKQRNVMTFVMAQPKPGIDAREVCERINATTELTAYTRDEFYWKTIYYFLGSTGIPVNFGVTIALGFIVGAAVTGQTFYLFTVENLRQFGALKAMGMTNGKLVAMILLQGTVVGSIGYSLGIGMCAMFFENTNTITHLAGLYLTSLATYAVGAATMLIIALSSFVSISKVLLLEPAIVFRE